MSYYVRTMSCNPQTLALTSNYKFLPVGDLLYIDQTSFMLKYPEECSSNDINQSIKLTDKVKHVNQISKFSSNVNQSSCKNC